MLKMKLLPSTMLDLARYPEDAFRAPLNTTKLAPVTDKKKKTNNNYILTCPILCYMIFVKCIMWSMAHFQNLINVMPTPTYIRKLIKQN